MCKHRKHQLQFGEKRKKIMKLKTTQNKTKTHRSANADLKVKENQVLLLVTAVFSKHHFRSATYVISASTP